MISRISHALRVTIMLSPHDQRMTNQLLSRLSAYVQQREPFGTQQTLCTSKRSCSLQAQLLQRNVVQLIDLLRSVDYARTEILRT